MRKKASSVSHACKNLRRDSTFWRRHHSISLPIVWSEIAGRVLNLFETFFNTAHSEMRTYVSLLSIFEMNDIQFTAIACFPYNASSLSIFVTIATVSVPEPLPESWKKRPSRNWSVIQNRCLRLAHRSFVIGLARYSCTR